MIRIGSIPQKGYSITEWGSAMDSDQEAKVWIFHQLMGETQKGDTLEFVYITGNDLEVYAGILRDTGSQMKAFIPAILARLHDGVLTVFDYSGKVFQTDNTVESSCRKIGYHCDIDQAVRKWYLCP